MNELKLLDLGGQPPLKAGMEIDVNVHGYRGEGRERTPAVFGYSPAVLPVRARVRVIAPLGGIEWRVELVEPQIAQIAQS